LRHERGNDLVPVLPLILERQDLAVHPGRGAAGEVGRAAGVDIEVAAAGAADPMLDRLEERLVVPFGRGRLRGAGRGRVPKGADISLRLRLLLRTGRVAWIRQA